MVGFLQLLHDIITRNKCKLRVIRCDNAFFTREIREWAIQPHIDIQLLPCIPHEHYQIGRVERKHQTLHHIVIKALQQPHLNLKYWLYALKDACYKSNLQSKKRLSGKSSFQLWYGKDPDIINHPILPFGTIIMSHIPLKLQTKGSGASKVTHYIGSAHDHFQAILVWDPVTKKTIPRRTYKELGPYIIEETPLIITLDPPTLTEQNELQSIYDTMYPEAALRTSPTSRPVTRSAIRSPPIVERNIALSEPLEVPTSNAPPITPRLTRTSVRGREKGVPGIATPVATLPLVTPVRLTRASRMRETGVHEDPAGAVRPGPDLTRPALGIHGTRDIVPPGIVSLASSSGDLQLTVDQNVDVHGVRQLEESKPSHLPSTVSALNESTTGTNNDIIDMHEAVKYRPLLTPSTIIPTSAIIPDTHDDDIHYYTDVNPKFKLHQRFRKNLKYINCSFNDTTTGEIFVISSVCRKNNGVLPFFKFYDNIKYLTPPISDDDYEYSPCEEILTEPEYKFIIPNNIHHISTSNANTNPISISNANTTTSTTNIHDDCVDMNTLPTDYHLPNVPMTMEMVYRHPHRHLLEEALNAELQSYVTNGAITASTLTPAAIKAAGYQLLTVVLFIPLRLTLMDLLKNIRCVWFYAEINGKIWIILTCTLQQLRWIPLD